MKRIIILATVLSFFGNGEVYAQKEVQISAKMEGQTFGHFWSKCVGAGRANEALRAGWLEQLQKVEENCGFEYVRFHGLFHDDMFPVLNRMGKLLITGNI